MIGRRSKRSAARKRLSASRSNERRKRSVAHTVAVVGVAVARDAEKSLDPGLVSAVAQARPGIAAVVVTVARSRARVMVAKTRITAARRNNPAIVARSNLATSSSPLIIAASNLEGTMAEATNSSSLRMEMRAMGQVAKRLVVVEVTASTLLLLAKSLTNMAALHLHARSPAEEGTMDAVTVTNMDVAEKMRCLARLAVVTAGMESKVVTESRDGGDDMSVSVPL
jgi:hypothetical protein